MTNFTDSPTVIPLWPEHALQPAETALPEQETLLPPPPTLPRTPLPLPFGIRLVHNVRQPALLAYLPEPAAASGTAVIVCPGGTFHFLAIEDEGSAVPTDAPPLFVLAASDDPLAVGASLPPYTAWRDAGQSVELHLYARGGHGFAMRQQGLPSDHWLDRFGDWLHAQGWLP